MTKRFLLIIFSFCIIANGFAQIQSRVFKTTQRQISDTTILNSPFVVVNGAKSNSKSSNSNSQSFSYLNSVPSFDTTIKVKYSKTSKLPIFIEKTSEATKSFKSDTTRCYAFLDSIKKYTGISKPTENFFISKKETDELGQTHIRMYQKYKGIVVYGSDFYVHLKKHKEQFTGKYQLIPNIVDTLAKVTQSQSVDIVNKDLRTKTIVTQLSDFQKKILKYDKPQSTLILKEVDGKLKSYKLMYQVTVRPNFIQEWIYFVDAMSGNIYESYDNTKYDGAVTANGYDLNNILRSINTYLEAGTYYLMDIAEPMFNVAKNEGYILTLDAQNTSTYALASVPITSTNNTWTNKTAVSAHYNAIQSYKYFKNTFNRNSISGEGGNIISFINVTDSAGNSMNNAFWNGEAAFYGNGGTKFKPLAGALDVTSHELGHGVVSNTAKLEYISQSGAINETFADIFGAMVSRDDWYIGEDITIDSKPLRDMSNPHNNLPDVLHGWQPKHMSEYVSGSILNNFKNRDNEGVHINSGITNYAYYLYATALTKEKAEQVFYRALNNYITSVSQFIDLRIDVIQAATDLYGETSNEVTSAKIAFDAVGIYDESSNNYFQDYPANTGTQYICYYDLDATHPSSFYATDMTNPAVGLTTYLANSRMSFTDNGLYGIYVSSTKTIRVVKTNTLVDDVLQSQTIWKNAVISKDGKHIAAIKNVSDTAIWVYDFTLAKWAKFHLFNPTTSNDNQNAGGVLFADGLEFDITGESLVYDAYNSLKSSTGTDISYWDIGFINVWDNQANNFGDGKIVKLYGSLPSKVSIGNPTFSKNSPYRIAFDYYDESTTQYAVLGSNIITGESGIITLNNDIGYPSYSPDDDVVVFTSKNGSDAVVKGILLEPNKISTSVSNSPLVLVNKAKWGVSFATGTRVLGLSPVANFTTSYKNGNTPLTVQFFDMSVNEPTSWLWTFEGGTPTSSTLQNPTVTYTNAGTFTVVLKATNNYGNHTVTKNSYMQVIQSSLSVTPNSLTITQPANSTKTFDITSNISWTISSSETWLSVSSASGSGNATITLTSQANTLAPARTAIVTVSGTGVVSQTVTVTQDGIITGIDKTENDYITIYPNPVTNTLFISGLTQSTNVSIIDSQGKMILSRFLYENQIDVNNLSIGIYTIKFENKSGTVVRRFIKQ